ncbi:MAG: arsenate reductase ArsC [Candidatus Omnitrophica bacterium]|nr:arsenate reductase ArsC [Candidatus Omnitrophota bacterium]
MKNKIKVLFVCIHNSARSQIAQGLLESIAGGKFIVESAGIKKGEISPLAIETMKEIGIDLSSNKSKTIDSLGDATYDYAITLCDEALCPSFSNAKETIHWSFKNPATLKGNKKEKLAKTREIRDKIRERISDWVETKKTHEGLREGNEP